LFISTTSSHPEPKSDASRASGELKEYYARKAATLRAEIRIRDMKKYICLLAGMALLAACEQKETTVTNPPAEKKESTTVINQPPATEKKEKTEVNVNTSPKP